MITTTFIRYQAGYKYRLASTLQVKTLITGHAGGTADIRIDPDGTLTLMEGFCFDGATGALDSRCAMRASAVHDALYRLMRARVLDPRYKNLADHLLEKLLIEDGMSRIRAALWRWAVQTFAQAETLPSHERPVLIAP